jgi:hypothetical protein
MARWLRCWLLSLLVLPATSPPAFAAPNPCEQAAADSEVAEHLPTGLLLAIGQVETGRWDATRARVAPWPWALNINGTAKWFPSREAALKALTEHWSRGTRSIDVGCFQVNLLHHPTAFADLAEALDPGANGAYAARFLTLLRNRLGNWNAAVAAYHSSDPLLGTPYQQLVFARLARPFVPSTVSVSIHVWTPAESGDDAHVVSIVTKSASLPHVIVPTR